MFSLRALAIHGGVECDRDSAERTRSMLKRMPRGRRGHHRALRFRERREAGLHRPRSANVSGCTNCAKAPNEYSRIRKNHHNTRSSKEINFVSRIRYDQTNRLVRCNPCKSAGRTRKSLQIEERFQVERFETTTTSPVSSGTQGNSPGGRSGLIPSRAARLLHRSTDDGQDSSFFTGIVALSSSSRLRFSSRWR
jgi:hypothetical protein